jgi:hypothetical protein
VFRQPVMLLAMLTSFLLDAGNPLLGRGQATNGDVSDAVSVKDYGARGDGVTDDLPAIYRAFASLGHKGHRVLFPGGTYGISGTVVIPSKTQIFGVGRGDPGFANTVIKALPAFPPGAAMVQMGAAPGPAFGIQIENMTIDGSLLAGTCLLNNYSQEQSFGRNLILGNCSSAGLRVSGGAAMNSGPFDNLEILPGVGPATNVNTLCVEVSSVGSFRGIRGLTCNAGDYYASRPAVAMKLDGTGVYQDIHVEHFATAVTLGSTSDSADTLIFADGTFGPDVTTGLVITAPPGVNNQNLTILGISCGTCKTLLRDDMTGTHISDSSVGWYLLGNGPGKYKAILSSNGGIGGQVFGPFRAQQVQITSDGPRPPCSALNRGTLWFVRSPRGVADQVQICSKTAADTYSWTATF